MAYTGEKKREYDRKWMAARRATYMKDKFCVVCGTKENLEIHHKNPEDKVSHRVWSWSEKRRLEELSKCEVRCKTHHQDVTGRAKHGTSSKYSGGCHCNLCRKSHAEYVRRTYHSTKRYRSSKKFQKLLNESTVAQR